MVLRVLCEFVRHSGVWLIHYLCLTIPRAVPSVCVGGGGGGMEDFIQGGGVEF